MHSKQVKKGTQNDSNITDHNNLEQKWNHINNLNQRADIVFSEQYAGHRFILIYERLPSKFCLIKDQQWFYNPDFNQ